MNGLAPDPLLATGVSLFMLGLVLRGLAAGHRRTMAARKLHELDTRKPGEPAQVPSHFDRHFGTYASATTLLGALLTVISVFR